MHTFNYRTQLAQRAAKALSPAPSQADHEVRGLISEVVYSEDQPWMTQLLLLPLLQQLSQQSRWQLWLTPKQKLSRQWVEASGLPLAKVMQVSQLDALFTVDAMVKALETGNYSVVIGWLSDELTDDEHFRLADAAEKGNAIGLIMRPNRSGGSANRPRSELKIHSSLYH